MSEPHWVNKPHFFGLQVGFKDSRLSFYDVVEGEVVRVYVDFASPRDSVFTLNASEEPLRGMTFIKGSGLCEREVIHYTNRRNAKRLRVGVTLHRSVFSSLPHAFEKSPVPGFEESFFLLLPEGGKALVEGEGLLGFDTVDTAWPMRNADMLAVPMGWHRVTALANEDGSVPSLAYIWAYIARDPGWEKD